MQNILNNADYPNVEFVVLDYDSQDGLQQWMKEFTDTFQKAVHSDDAATIVKGLEDLGLPAQQLRSQQQIENLKRVKITYAKLNEQNKPFHMAHSKNMAHRVAMLAPDAKPDDIVCALDADNVTAPGYARWLNETFNRQEQQGKPNTVVCQRLYKTLMHRALVAPVKGIAGRIAVTQETFRNVCGYDERFQGWGGEDFDFIARLTLSGTDMVGIPAELYGSVIQHSNAERTEHMGEVKQNMGMGGQGTRMQARLNYLKNAVTGGEFEDAKRQNPSPVWNAEGYYGTGEVLLDFAKEATEIGPLIPQNPATQAVARSR